MLMFQLGMIMNNGIYADQKDVNNYLNYIRTTPYGFNILSYEQYGNFDVKNLDLEFINE